MGYPFNLPRLLHPRIVSDRRGDTCTVNCSGLETYLVQSVESSEISGKLSF